MHRHGHRVTICPTETMQQRSMGHEDCEKIDVHLHASVQVKGDGFPR